MKILESYKGVEFGQLIVETGEVYVKDLEVRVRVYRGAVVIRELQEALKVGGVCPQYKIAWRDYQDGDLALAHYVHDKGIKDLPGLIEVLKGFEFQEDAWGGYAPIDVPGGVFTVYREDFKGVHTFSPFQVARLKPLKEVPKKWTVKHAVRAIASGQYKELRCKGVYTDDYSYDAAVGYQAGEIKAPLEFIEGIIERPSGWWSTLDGDEVYLSCHHFDSNGFKLAI